MWITLATDANWSAAVPSLRGWQHHITSPVHPEFQMRQRRLALPLQEQVDGGVDLPQAGLVGGEAPQGATVQVPALAGEDGEVGLGLIPPKSDPVEEAPSVQELQSKDGNPMGVLLRSRPPPAASHRLGHHPHTCPRGALEASKL